MEPTFKDFQNAVKTLEKEIDLENQAFMNSVKLKIFKMTDTNVSKQSIREYFGTGAGMLQWESHKNKIRKIIADFVASVAEVSYYKGLVSDA